MASKFLIKIESFFNLSIERAIASDTASGIPSGIATIRTQRAIMKIWINSEIVFPEKNPAESFPETVRVTISRLKI
jgi:hypothetical protein